MPREQIEKWWDDWRLWRMTGRRVESFVIARRLPKAMLETLFFLDYFYQKMETKNEKDEQAKKARKR